MDGTLHVYQHGGGKSHRKQENINSASFPAPKDFENVSATNNAKSFAFPYKQDSIFPRVKKF